METPVPRTVTPSSSSSPDLLQEVSGTALTQAYQDLEDNADAFSGDTVLMEGITLSPPYISQSPLQADQPVHRPIPLRRAEAAAGAAPRRQPELILNYPEELNFVPQRSRKRPRQASPQPTPGPSRPKQAKKGWPTKSTEKGYPTPRIRLEQTRQPGRSVYGGYHFVNPNPADPRTAHDSSHRQRRAAIPRSEPVLIPTHENSPDHELWDHSGSDSPTTPVGRHAMSPSVSSDEEEPQVGSEQLSRASSVRSFSRASSHASSAFSRAPTHGDHPPTRFGGVAAAPARDLAPVIRQQEPDLPPVVYGPVPYDCPLDAIELPVTEPLDALTDAVRPKLNQLMNTVYLNPLPTDKLAELYKSYPRPANVEVLHKTRLNDDVKRALTARARDSVVTRDDQLSSLQWCLQFAARPILQVLDHVSDGSQLDAKFVARKAVDALKLIAKASWKQNDARRHNVYAGLKGTGLEVAQEHQNHTNFEHLLGSNPREQIAARQKEDETLREVVAPPRHGGNSTKPRQGNSRGGQPRGRQNNQGGRHQSRGRQRHQNGDKSRQGSGQPQQSGSSHRGGGQKRPRGRGQSNPNRHQNNAK